MSDETNFRAIRRKLSPSWLNDGDGGLVGYSLDLVKDAFMQRMYLALLARYPDFAEDDSLAVIGRERRLRRGLTESREAYQARLKNFMIDWEGAGNAFTTLARLAAYLGPLPKIQFVDARGNWYTRLPDGTTSYTLNTGNWNWDAASIVNNWARFWIIIHPNGLWDPLGDWGDSPGTQWADNNVTWGSTATFDEVQSVRHIIKDSKRAGCTCVNIVVAFDNSTFNPATPTATDGLWKNWSKNVAGVQVPARLSSAVYWDGASTSRL